MDWSKTKEVAESYREQILTLPGVVGISTGVRREAGEAEPCIKIYLSKPVKRGKLKDLRIPWELEEVPVEVIVTGEIVALDDDS